VSPWPPRASSSPAAPIHYQYDPVRTTKTSVHGAINMLGLAKRVKAKILQALRGEPITIYGEGAHLAAVEDIFRGG